MTQLKNNELQPGILDEKALNGRFMIFDIKDNVNGPQFRKCLSQLVIDKRIIVGLGKKALATLNISEMEYREFPQLDAEVKIPATGGDLFVCIRDTEAGKVAMKSLQVKQVLSECMQLKLLVDGFKYLGNNETNGHDLTGYEDGTENPVGDDAVSAVMRQDGSCFVVLQQWQHDLEKFNGFSQEHKDNTIGRRLSDNVELSDAPASSHVNRSDQGTFDIDADIVRRSMPYANEHGEGLMFIAYCENLDRFEVQMRRMAGLNDGVIDALFTFSKILNSAYFYCPAVNNNKLVLT